VEKHLKEWILTWGKNLELFCVIFKRCVVFSSVKVEISYCLALLPRLFLIGYVHVLEAAYTLRKPGRNCEMPARRLYLLLPQLLIPKRAMKMDCKFYYFFSFVL
jgi:hypothetical protein